MKDEKFFIVLISIMVLFAVFSFIDTLLFVNAIENMEFSQ